METANKLLADLREGNGKGIVDVHLTVKKVIEVFEDDWEEVEEGEVRVPEDSSLAIIEHLDMEECNL